MKSYSLKRDEILKSRISTARLFKKGKRVKSQSIQVIWLPVSDEKGQSKVMFSVPKKFIRQATDRNRIKRQMREIYRLEKPRIQEGIPGSYHMALLYLTSEKMNYEEMKSSLDASFSKILNHNL